MKKIAFVALLLVLSVSMVFVGCSSQESDTIKIGGIFPLSGSVAVYGIEAKNGVEMAIAEINAAGGINGKMVELISEDDEGDPEISVNAYKKLTSRDGVKVIIGSLTSGCTAAISSLAQAQGVLLVAPAATAESITDAGNYVFRACFIDPFQGTVGAKFALDNLGKSNAAVLYDIGNDYSVGLYENFKATFEAAGGSVTAESYTTGDKDFNAQLTKIKTANPDVVYIPDYYSTVALIASQLRAQGIDVEMIGADGWDGIVDNAGDEVLNGYYSNHYAADSTDERVVTFVTDYVEMYGSTPVSFAALGYDSMYLIKDAMMRAGAEADTEAVRAEMENTSGAYVTGDLSFDDRRNPVKSAVIVEIVSKDGKLTPVYSATVNP